MFGLLFVILGVGCILLSEKLLKKSPYGYNDGMVMFTRVVGIIICLVIVIGSIIVPINFVGYNTNIKYQQKKYTFYQDWRKNTLPKLIEQADKYLPYEQSTMKSFVTEGAMLNVPPNLKTNTTIIKIVDEIKQADKQLLNTKINIAKNKILIERNYRIGRWFAVYAPR